MAQERKKRRIVLASILKPVDDTRMLEKIGASLSEYGDYEVTIIGYPASGLPSRPDVRLHPLPPFERLSLKRVLIKWKVFQMTLAIEPDIFLFNTHELLLPAVLLKVFLPVSVVYDVLENHYRNIVHSGSFPAFVRRPLALWVRLKEKLLAPSVDHFLLAERGYENEFKFHRGGSTVIENKAVIKTSRHRPRADGRIRLLFTGTLAESTGIFRAIRFAKELHKLDTGVSLTIAGYAAKESTQQQLRREEKENPFIRLAGVEQLLPHHVIEEQISSADFGLLAYPPSEHTRNSRPTKLYEYLAARLPIILEGHWPWISEFAGCRPFVLVDFAEPNPEEVLNQLKTRDFYAKDAQDVAWESEASKLLTVLESL